MYAQRVRYTTRNHLTRVSQRRLGTDRSIASTFPLKHREHNAYTEYPTPRSELQQTSPGQSQYQNHNGRVGQPVRPPRLDGLAKHASPAPHAPRVLPPLPGLQGPLRQPRDHVVQSYLLLVMYTSLLEYRGEMSRVSEFGSGVEVASQLGCAGIGGCV